MRREPKYTVPDLVNELVERASPILLARLESELSAMATLGAKRSALRDFLGRVAAEIGKS